jgi:hypothetical protein
MRWKLCGELEDDDSVGFAMPQGRMKKEYLKVDQVGAEQLGDLDGLYMLALGCLSVEGKQQRLKTDTSQVSHSMFYNFKLHRSYQGKSTVKKVKELWPSH